MPYGHGSRPIRVPDLHQLEEGLDKIFGDLILGDQIDNGKQEKWFMRRCVLRSFYLFYPQGGQFASKFKITTKNTDHVIHSFCAVIRKIEQRVDVR